MITVNHQPLSVDIPAELEVYLDKFPQHLIRDDKLQSCSPFRQESHPIGQLALGDANGDRRCRQDRLLVREACGARARVHDRLGRAS